MGRNPGAMAVYMKCFWSGRKAGDQYSASPRVESGATTSVDIPPNADTRSIDPARAPPLMPAVVAKRITSSRFQLAPAAVAEKRHSVDGGPPAAGTFITEPSVTREKNPM